MSGGDKELEKIGNTIVNVLKSIYEFFKNVVYGCKELQEKKARIYWLITLSVLGLSLFLLREKIWLFIPRDNNRLMPVKYSVYVTPFIPLIYLNYLGDKHKKSKQSYDEMFDKIGFYGKSKIKKKTSSGEYVEARDYPKFIGETKEEDITIYSFYSNINLQEWRAKLADLENALDCNILKIENAKTTKKVVKIHTVPSDMAISEYLEWKDEYILEEDFKLVIGENMLDKISFNLNSVPHVLVAGETGSGKSVILRLILWQVVKKGAKIYMVDFKGGVEFGKRYEKFGEVLTEKQRVLEVLKELTFENKARLEYFRELDVKNLGQYNKLAEAKGLKKLTRIIVFIDELAEMLDKSGASKEEKELMAQIEKEISTLARLARATGINLVIGVQRPDAKVLTGQIKNNIPVRISGRFADKPASEIVLGNSRATDLPNTKGRFLYKVGADTLEFQAYLFDDDRMLKDVEYETGGMLTKENEIEKEKEKVDNRNTVQKVNNKILDLEKSDIEPNEEYCGYENYEDNQEDYEEDYEDDEDLEVDLNDHDLYGELEDEEFEIINEEGF